MINTQLAKKYARAIFEIAQESGKLETYETNLRDIRSTVCGQSELQRFVEDPQIPVTAKKSVVEKIFSGDTLVKDVYNFLLLLVDKRRMALLNAIVDEFKTLSNEALGIAIADVTTAVKMDEAQAQGLKAKLQEVSGKRVELRTHVDAGIIGGVIVQMGDKRIDGSVTGRLQALKSEIMANQ
ncbi:ATP synthase F1 subunit delta [Selenomonas sp. TAMA-11512]|uniref:ATP synthase F1 subunit delta n=1 Tax=Selenomonas sp. TAMA-11512 TaxID=3095337 RepID=UPI00308B458E|nr:ATP synthase F1 subunit delta [Selenomonas sp. TAMA-11512]